MLTDEQKAQLTARAEAAGLSPDAVIKAAVAMNSGEGEPTEGEPTLAAERFLIGYLPYVTVREFRELVLGLSGDVADSSLFTGEWLDLHGGEGTKPKGGEE